MTLRPGDVVGRRYALEALVGAGGMGEVYRAHDAVLARRVAVKLVYDVDPRREAETQQAFLREARISAAITHPNVVQILDFGLHEGRVPFMVMELLEGESLGHILRRGDAISMDFVMEVIPQVLAGLAVAHDARVIHRDLKPDNIFLARTREGLCPKILDFGISKSLGTVARSSFKGTTSSAARILGTPAYMSPEQARGGTPLDERTDVYSMGVVLYELFSGLLPFYAESPYELLTKIIQEEEKPLREISGEVSPEVEACVAKAMRKNPSRRHADAHALRAALLSAAPTMSGHRLPQRSARSEESEPIVTLSELPTMMVTPRAGAPFVVDSADAGAAPTEAGTSSDVPVSASRSPRRRAQKLTLAVLVAAVSVVTLVIVMRSRTSPRFIVVNAKATPSHSGETDGPHSKLGSSASPTVESPDPSAKAADPAQLLTRSLREQKVGLARCVRLHRALALRHPSLSLKFDVAADGRVLAATPSPTEIRASPLGACLVDAAKGVRFDPPGMALSLDVPLTTRH